MSHQANSHPKSHRWLLTLLAAAALAGSTVAAAAQGTGTSGTSSTPGTGSTVPGAAPGSPATPPAVAPSTPSTTGSNTGGINQPGVPDTSTPGRIGTGAAPSGLPGDNPTNPGYPGKVGQPSQ
jgi:hypothetical protein